MIWLALGAGLLLGAALLYWQLELAEGAYLGPKVVVWLYDRFAPRYDATKKFNPVEEDWFLGRPLAQALAGIGSPLVLDVATGTGRLPLTLCRQPDFGGRVVALDLSRQMLHHAAHNLAALRDRVTLVWQDATCLPFPDAAFDAATCLEALEFLPDAHATLTEMVRVLRPGGILLTTNRIGGSARWLPGRTMGRDACIALLSRLGLEQVRVNAWQVDYDLVWAHKGGWSTRPAPATLAALLRCPHCATRPLTPGRQGWSCSRCGRWYPLAADGVIELNRPLRR